MCFTESQNSADTSKHEILLLLLLRLLLILIILLPTMIVVSCPEVRDRPGDGGQGLVVRVVFITTTIIITIIGIIIGISSIISRPRSALI